MACHRRDALTQRAELRAELWEITRQARALLEWFDAAGTAGVPRDPGQPSGISLEPKATDDGGGPTTRRSRAPERADEAGQGTPATASDPTPGAASSPSPPLADGADRAARLEALETRVRTCTACPLHAHRTQTVFARGASTAALAFVGEGPGAQEDAQGVPFVGPAGELLDRMIQAMGLTRDDVYVCNIVKCRPPKNRKPTPEEMLACEPFLREQLELVDPEVVVAMGATAAQGLLGWHDAGPHGPGITRLRGQWKLYAGRTPLMPTFHPAYLLRSPEKKRDVWADLQAVMKRLGLEPPTRPGRSRS